MTLVHTSTGRVGTRTGMGSLWHRVCTGERAGQEMKALSLRQSPLFWYWDWGGDGVWRASARTDLVFLRRMPRMMLPQTNQTFWTPRCWEGQPHAPPFGICPACTIHRSPPTPPNPRQAHAQRLPGFCDVKHKTKSLGNDAGKRFMSRLSQHIQVESVQHLLRSELYFSKDSNPGKKIR